jgi:hypothetical protein
MRRLLTVLAVLVAAALALPQYAGAQDESARDKIIGRSKKLDAAAAPAAVGGGTASSTYNTAFTRFQRNHFGDPAQGFVILDGWIRNRPNINDTFDPADIPTLGRGCYSAFLPPKVKRVQLNSVRVLDADSDTVVAASAGPVNSGDVNRLVQLCTSAFDETAAPVRYYVEVNAAVRWADGTLSSGVVTATTRDTNQFLVWSAIFGA